MLKDDTYEEIPVITNLKDFIDDSDMIIANRLSSDLINHENKVFTRDLFQSDI